MYKIIIVALLSTGDYNSNLLTLEYPAASVNGTTLCIDVTANTDLFVECEETFYVSLTIEETGGLNASVANFETAVMITDSQGMYATIQTL